MKIRKNDIFLYGRKMLFQMLEILYPRRCAVCDEIEVTGKGICPLCKDKVHVAGEPACKKCGKPLVDERKEFCTDCGKKHHTALNMEIKENMQSFMRMQQWKNMECG